VPPDSVRCTRGLRLQLFSFGKIQSRRAIIHRTVRCTPDSVRCSKEGTAQELASLGNSRRLLRYNSPDMSGVHRTVRCATGQCPVHQRSQTPTLLFRENPEPARYNSPDCPVYTGQCPVLQRRHGSGTRQSREFAKAAPL
jgi:hypothetical protein